MTKELWPTYVYFQFLEGYSKDVVPVGVPTHPLGPTFGPFRAIECTYNETITITQMDGTPFLVEPKAYETWFYFDGVWYRKWRITAQAPSSITTLDPEKLRLPRGSQQS